MQFHILTLFPDIFHSYLNASILGRAQKRKLIHIKIYNLWDAISGKRKVADDKPYGGGAGMVLKAEPILNSLKKIKAKNAKVVILSAKGKPFTQKMAYQWAKKYPQIVLVSGRYEGIDERVRLALKAEEVSIGPYVTTDGDVGAMVLISAVARLLPGVIRLDSLAEESHWYQRLHEEATAATLEYPHYTRPEILRYKGKVYRVPKVLLSGNHKAIAAWRKKHTKKATSVAYKKSTL